MGMLDGARGITGVRTTDPRIVIPFTCLKGGIIKYISYRCTSQGDHLKHAYERCFRCSSDKCYRKSRQCSPYHFHCIKLSAFSSQMLDY